MADNTIELALTLDESNVTSGLKNISSDLGKIEDSASSAENSLDNAFQTGKIRQYERETNKAANANKRLDRNVKQTTRSQSRNVRATNAATSALSRYIGVNNKAISGIRGVGSAMAATPFGIFIAGFVAVSTALDFLGIDLFTTDDAMNKLVERTKELTAETEKLTEANEKQAQKLAIEELKARGAAIEDINAAISNARKKSSEENFKLLEDTYDKEQALLKSIGILETNIANEFISNSKKIDYKKELELREAELENTLATRRKLSLANKGLNIEEVKQDKESYDKKAALRRAANDRRIKEEARLSKELQAIQEKILKEEIKTRLELVIDAQQKEIEVRESQADEQIKSVNSLFDRQREILAKQIKDEAQLNTKLAALAVQQKNLITGIETDKQNDLKGIRKKYRDEDVKDFKDFLSNIVNQSLANTKTRIEIERAKFATQQEMDRKTFFEVEHTEKEITAFKQGQNEARLRNEKNLQIAILEAILKAGQAKTKLEKDLIKAQIDQLKAEVDNVGVDEGGTTESKGGFGLFKMLGIDITPEAQQSAVDELKKLGSTVLDELSKQAGQRAQIAADQIAQSDRELTRLNSNLDREIRLLENGDAANIERQKQAIAEQEELRKKAIADQKKAQQAQFAIDTASQTVNLITASTEIFKNLSAGFPYTLPLAIGAVAAMFGAFAASRVQAAKAVGLAEGGIIPLGRDDRQNTTSGYRVGDTNMFVGGGEYVTPVAQTRDSIGLLKAIHKGELTDVDLDAVHQAKNKGLTASVVKRTEVRNNGQKEVYKEVMRESIKEQTSELGKHLRTLVDKPTIFQLSNGDLVREYVDSNGNKTRLTTKAKDLG